MKTFANIGSLVGYVVRRAVAFTCFLFAFMLLMGAAAMAQTDLPSTITAVSGYWTSAEVVAISVLVFVVGRKIIRKI